MSVTERCDGIDERTVGVEAGAETAGDIRGDARRDQRVVDRETPKPHARRQRRQNAQGGAPEPFS